MNRQGLLRSKLNILTAAVLVVSMLVSPCGMIMTGHADSVVSAPASTFGSSVRSSFLQAVSGSQRVRAASEEKDLYTKIYINSDGSRTMEYYASPVKFINGSDETQDISLSLRGTEDGGYAPLSHYISASLPGNLSNGIKLDYSSCSVRITPETPGTLSATGVSRSYGEITYKAGGSSNGASGSGSIEYSFSLTYTGVKEVITVPAYNGQTVFSFVLELNGLVPEKVECNGWNYYLLKDASGKIRGRLGETMVTSAGGKNNGICSVSLMPQSQSEGSTGYLLNIGLDEAYLNDPATVYPLSIESSIDLLYNTPDPITCNSIEDITVNQNAVSDSPYSGTLYVGRAGEDYGKMRSVVRFPNLNLLGIHTDDIISANLYMRDLMCYGTPLEVDCYEYCGILPSTAFTTSNMTWSLVDTETSGYEASGAVKASHQVSYSDGFASGHEYAFDISFAVRDWINGAGHGAPSPQHAVVFKSTDAHENTDLCQYVCFGSSDRAAHKPYLVIDYSGRETGPDTTGAGNMTANTVVEVNIPVAGSKAYFAFTPSSTGIYSFEGFGQGSTGDTVCRLYNEYGELLCESDNEGNGSNFNIPYHLRQGITYYYEAGLGGNATGTYMAAFTEALAEDPVNATELELGYNTEISTIKAYEVCFVKLEPGRTVEYLLFSSETNSDPVIWIYDSDYDQVTMNDDGAGGGNFKAETILTAGETYYAVIGFDRDRCGGLRLNTMSDPELEAGEYYIRNCYNEALLTPLVSGTGRLPGMVAFNSQLDQRWTVSPVTNGYLFDTSGRNAFRLEATSGFGSDNTGVSLGNNMSNSDSWKVYEDGDHKFLIESLCIPGKKLSIVLTEAGNEIRLVPISKTDNSNSASWRLIKAIYGKQKFVGMEELSNSRVNCMGYALFVNSSLDLLTERSVVDYLLTEYSSIPVSDFSEEVRAHVDDITKNAFEIWMDEHMICYEYESDFDNNGQNRILNSNQYRIVLRSGLQPYRDCDITDEVGHYDYHFWYQTYDGTWANKHGDDGIPTHLAEEETPFTNDSSGWYCSFYGVDYPCFYSGQIYSYIITIS